MVLALGVVAPVANAKIVIGQSIAGVKLGSTKAQVKKVLGSPSNSDPTDFFYPGRGLRINFKGGRVDLVLSISKRQKTDKGITVGSSFGRFKRAYPKASCLEGPFGPSSRYCAVTTRFHGRQLYTSFLFPSLAGSVSEIELGFGPGLAAEAHKP